MSAIKAKKSLGQNFLTDKNIASKIIRTLGIESGDHVLEIGPGTGALTEMLLELDIKLTVVEIDKRAYDLLNEKFEKHLNGKLAIVNSDIRDFKIADNYKDIVGKSDLRVIGNIPYNISSDIFFLLFENASIIKRAVLTIQKELAQRLQARINTKAYGILTVAMALTGRAKIQFDIPPSCFYPRPEVTSSVISMDFHMEQHEYEEFRDIMKLVKSAFNQRRKMLRNSLKPYVDEALGINMGEFGQLSGLHQVGDLLNKRPENLDTDSFIALYKFIESQKKSE